MSGRFSNTFSPFFLSFRSIKDDVIVAQLLLRIFRATIMVRKFVPRDTDHGEAPPPLPIENQLIKFHSFLSPPPLFPSTLTSFRLCLLFDCIHLEWRRKEEQTSCFLWKEKFEFDNLENRRFEFNFILVSYSARDYSAIRPRLQSPCRPGEQLGKSFEFFFLDVGY